jgi:uncharacterized protein YegP (UPF0339 family)
MTCAEYWHSGRDGRWYYILISDKGTVLAQSAGFATKENCLSRIRQVQRYIAVALILEIESAECNRLLA